MAEAADLIMRAHVQGGREAVATLDQLDASARKAEASAESYGDEQSRLAQQLRQAEAAMKTQKAALDATNVVNLAHARSARLAGHEVANLTRQLGDVATMAAMGASPMSILTTQGFQVAEIFGIAQARGVGFAAALGQIGQMVGGLLVRLAPVTLAVGAVTGAFALFEREIDKNTKASTTWGDTFQATINVIGDRLMNGPIGEGLRWMRETFRMVMDAIVNGAMGALDRMVGFFGAAYLAITKHWRQFPQVLGAIMTAAANNALEAVEWLVNKVGAAVNRIAGKKLIKAIDLPAFQQASNQVADTFVEDQRRIEESFRRTREQFSRDVVGETDRLAAAREKAEKASKAHAKATKAYAKATKEEADALKELRDRLKGVMQALETPAERELRVMHEQMRVLREGFDAGELSVEEYRKLIDRAWYATQDLVKVTGVDLVQAAGSLNDIRLDTWRTELDRVYDATRDVAWAVDDVFRAIEDKDWLGAFSGLLRAIDRVGEAWKLNQPGSRSGAVGSLLSVAGSGVGGTAGGVLSGIGSGFSATSALATAGAAMAKAGMSMADLVSAAAGPIGWVVGGLSVLSSLIKDRPSNAGAGYDLITGQLSGNKRTQETESAVIGAAEAIKDIEQTFKDAGINLTDSVRGLVIGSRDASTIYLTSGKELKSAVGDVGAAVETALRAMLESATFASEGQERVAKAAMAAGGGLEAVAQALDAYAAAQQISANLADEILRLTDPKAYDLKAVTDGIEAQRKAAADLQAQGYLTAEQLAVINEQFATLQALQLAEVTARYTQASNDNSAERISQRRSELMIEIMRLNGEAEEALRIERELQLAAMEPELRGLQQIKWARGDETAAMAKAQQELEAAAQAAAHLASQQLNLTERFYGAANDNVALTRLQRERELASVTDEASRAILRGIHAMEDMKAAEQAVAGARAALQSAYDAEAARLDAKIAAHDAAVQAVTSAEDALRAAYQRTAGEFQQTIDKWKSLASSLADFRRGLSASDLGGGTTTQRYGAARADLDRIAALARSGDEAAAGQLQGVIQTFLGASRAASPTSASYMADVARAKSSLLEAEKAAGQQVDVATRQLHQLTRQAGALIDLNGGVLSVHQAILLLETAKQAEKKAKEEADAARDQKTLLEQQVSGLLAVNTSVISVGQAVNNLKTAIASQSSVVASAVSTVAAALQAIAQIQAQDQARDQLRESVATYLGTNAQGQATFLGFTRPELGWNGSTYAVPPNALPPAARDTLLALQEVKRVLGPNGVPGFARGGDHTGGWRIVGEEGPEIEATGPARYFSAEQTRSILQDDGEGAAQLRRQNELLEEQNRLLRKIADSNKSLDDREALREFSGIRVRGETPEDPVPTKEAA